MIAKLPPGNLLLWMAEPVTVLCHLVLIDFSITQGGVPSHNANQDPGSIVVRDHTRTGAFS